VALLKIDFTELWLDEAGALHTFEGLAFPDPERRTIITSFTLAVTEAELESVKVIVAQEIALMKNDKNFILKLVLIV
jgi:hypothetical protein